MTVGDRVVIRRPGTPVHDCHGIVEYEVGDWPVIVAVPDSVAARRDGNGLVVCERGELVADRDWIPQPVPDELPDMLMDVPERLLKVQQERYAKWLEDNTVVPPLGPADVPVDAAVDAAAEAKKDRAEAEGTSAAGPVEGLQYPRPARSGE